MIRIQGIALSSALRESTTVDAPRTRCAVCPESQGRLEQRSTNRNTQHPSRPPAQHQTNRDGIGSPLLRAGWPHGRSRLTGAARNLQDGAAGRRAARRSPEKHGGRAPPGGVRSSERVRTGSDCTGWGGSVRAGLAAPAGERRGEADWVGVGRTKQPQPARKRSDGCAACTRVFNCALAGRRGGARSFA